MHEYLLSTNKYKKPYALTDKDALSVLIIRLLLMEPGTHPLHPEMGIDLIGRYRYCSKDDIPQLQNEIESQIETYLPGFHSLEVTPYISDSKLKIKVTIDDTLFNFTTGEEANEDEISLV